MLPAAGVDDRGLPPHAAGPGEVEEEPRAVAGAVLHQVVAVEHDGLHPREGAHLPVHVAPARLHHGNLRVGEVAGDGPHEIGLRDEVGVEDGDQLALGDLHPVLEGAGLVAHAVGPVDVHRVEPAIAQALDVGARDRARLVGRVVEDLDLQLARRVVHLGDRLEQALHHGGLVEQRELDRDVRQRRRIARGDPGRVLDPRRDLLPMFPAEQHEVQPMHAVAREEEQNREVEDAKGDVHRGLRGSNIAETSDCHRLVIPCRSVSRSRENLPFVIAAG